MTFLVLPLLVSFGNTGIYRDSVTLYIRKEEVQQMADTTVLYEKDKKMTLVCSITTTGVGRIHFIKGSCAKIKTVTF